MARWTPCIRAAPIEPAEQDRSELLHTRVLSSDRSTVINAVIDVLRRFGGVELIFVSALTQRLFSGLKPDQGLLTSAPSADRRVDRSLVGRWSWRRPSRWFCEPGATNDALGAESGVRRLRASSALSGMGCLYTEGFAPTLSQIRTAGGRTQAPPLMRRLLRTDPACD